MTERAGGAERARMRGAALAMGEEEPAATTEIFGQNRKNAVESWEIPFHGLGKLESVMECTHGMGRENGSIMLNEGGGDEGDGGQMAFPCCGSSFGRCFDLTYTCQNK